MHNNPLRLDVAIITVNKAEDDSISAIFELPYSGDEAELGNYPWGIIGNGQEKIYVAHFSLDDKSGVQAAILKTQQICNLLYPSYILILGIAGGNSEKKENPEECINLGDIIVAKIIQHGPISSDHIRENPLLQPAPLLFHNAKELDRTDKKTVGSWRSLIKKNPPEDEDAKSIVHFGELVSTDQMIDDLINNPKIDQALKNFPRWIAVDMEAGGVAGALFDRYSAGMWTPGFFVIKGISDLVNSDEQTIERHAWRGYAAEAAAAFARSLIGSFKKRVPTHIMRLLPEKLANRKANTDCSGVLHSILPEHYSAIAEHILNKIAPLSDFGSSLFFTVCAYDPKKLYDMALEKYKNEMRTDPVDIETLVNWTLDRFAHFRKFGDMAKEYKNKCYRILLLQDSKKREDIHWIFFVGINCGVRFWTIDRHQVKSIMQENLFLTDYVILGDRILLDYYDESQTLIMSDLRDPIIKGQLLGLRDLFFQKMSQGDLVPFEEITGISVLEPS